MASTEYPVAKFLVPDWGDKVKLWMSYRQSGYMGWRGVRQPYAGVNYIPPVRDFEFGYRNGDESVLKSGIIGYD